MKKSLTYGKEKSPEYLLRLEEKKEKKKNYRVRVPKRIYKVT